MNVIVFTAAEQMDERIRLILEADLITRLKTFLTPTCQSRQLAVRLIAELVKTGTYPPIFCYGMST